MKRDKKKTKKQVIEIRRRRIRLFNKRKGEVESKPKKASRSVKRETVKAKDKENQGVTDEKNKEEI